MSGHNPIQLVLTPGPLPRAETIEALLAFLGRNYHAIVRRKGSTTGCEPMVAFGRILLGSQQVSIDITFMPVDAQPDRVCPRLVLGAAAWEAAYDTMRHRVRPRGRQTLIAFCTAAATAIAAEGFLLEWAADDKDRSPITIETLLEAILYVEDCGMINGIAKASPAAARLRESNRTLTEAGDYLLVEFL